ncbi:MAG: CAP domain-containing protein [Gemmatimonadetes bacterium]|nr:CAP domain-containing protein [Gemmatimonadota bacterium]
MSKLLQLVSMLLLPLEACAELPRPDEGRAPTRGAETSPVPRSRPLPSDSPVQLARSVHEKINAYRIAQGLESLELHESLNRLAQEHSAEMASHGVPLGHEGFGDRAQAIRKVFPYSRLAENVGYNWGMADPVADAVARWLRSPQHRDNVIGDFESTGVGVVRNERGEYYFTQIFLDVRD